MGNEFEIVEVGFKVRNDQLRSQLGQADQMIARFAAQANSRLSGIGFGGGGGIGGGGSSSGGIGSGGLLPGLSQFSNIINALPQVGQLIGSITGPMAGAVEQGIRYNAFLERSQMALEGVAGSSEKANAHLQKLISFSNKTPFNLEGLMESTTMLTAFGFKLEEQIPMLKIWGDAVSSTGEISAEKLNRITIAFGQMRAKGKASAEEILQLTEAGIPAWELLAKAIGKTVQETQKLVAQGKGKGDVTVKAITAMMSQDPRFKGQMERLQNSYTGRLSSLQDMMLLAQAEGTKRMFQNTSGAMQVALNKEQLLSNIANQMNGLVGPISDVILAGIRTAAGEQSIPSLILQTITSGKELGSNALGIVAPMLGLGTDAIKGFITGFAGEQAKQLITQGAQTVISTTTSGIANAQKSNSPAKEFIPLGRDAADGYLLGFTERLKEVGGINPADFFNTKGKSRVQTRETPNNRSYLEGLLRSDSASIILAFFDAIRKAEGGRENLIVGGKKTFNPLGDHPNIIGLRTSAGPSTAAGNFQITGTNWFGNKRKGMVGLKDRLGADSFDSYNQLLAAMMLFNDRAGGAGMSALLRGDIDTAMRVAAKDWTSTPGSTIGGGGQKPYKTWMGYFNDSLTQIRSGQQPYIINGQNFTNGALNVNVVNGIERPGGLEMFKSLERPGGLEMFSSIGAPGGLENFREAAEPPNAWIARADWTSPQVRQAIADYLEKTKQVRAEQLLTTQQIEVQNQITYRTLEVNRDLYDASLQANLEINEFSKKGGEWLEDWIGKAKTLKERLDELRNNLPTMGETLNNVLVGIPEQASNVIANAAANWDGTFQGFFRSVAQGFQQMAQQIISELIRIAMMKLLLSLFGGLLGGGGGIGVDRGGLGGLATAGGGALGGFAAGGLIQGAGTDTSDNIPIWASPGEFVVNAKATRAVGADYLNFINKKYKYAAGGMVSETTRYSMNSPFSDSSISGSYSKDNHSRGSNTYITNVNMKLPRNYPVIPAKSQRQMAEHTASSVTKSLKGRESKR